MIRKTLIFFLCACVLTQQTYAAPNESKVFQKILRFLFETKIGNSYRNMPVEEIVNALDNLNCIIRKMMTSATTSAFMPWKIPDKIIDGLSYVVLSPKNHSIVLTLLFIMFLDASLKKSNQKKTLQDLFKRPESRFALACWICIAALYGTQLTNQNLSNKNLTELIVKLGFIAGIVNFWWNIIHSYFETNGHLKITDNFKKAIKTGLLSSAAMTSGYGTYSFLKHE